ncbi:hypothetical protein SAMN05660443_0619 [Marinospirillum celere]|uniref:Cobyrinic acid a,c-diamide synthase n=1 Tax=Marinospirillum celere TaxID=1122252 RepID=A0A1I1EHL6_9GAMM|nr:hypothetical protein [Marinospirillum celere]SFB86674.1 hypothetical protein SAMN05660443_0619 [Marinospirillum celere]
MSFFLQGMALGLFMISPVMLMLGIYNPGWVLPKHRNPGRFRVIGTYAFMLPVISFFLGVSTFWGGFGPTLLGWLTGVLMPVMIKLLVDAGYEQELNAQRRKTQDDLAEKRKQAAMQENQERGTSELKASHLTRQDDPLLHRLAALKEILRGYPQLLEKPLYLQQPDRFYSRYLQLANLLARRFQPDEITARRLRQLALRSLQYAVDRFEAMEPLLGSLQGLDQEYVKRRLQGARHQAEKQALEDRQRLIEQLHNRLLELMAENEMALTTLDTTLTSLASINTDQRGGTEAANQALNELKRFSEQLNEYDRSVMS